MKTVYLVAAGAMTFAIVSSASGRVVPYTLDRPAIEAAAADQKITGPFSDVPIPPEYPITLEEPMAADHSVKTVSIYCQAYKIENPVSVLMQKLLPAPSAPANGAGLTVRLVKGSTLLRCLGTGELKAICKNEVKITAEASFRNRDGTIVKLPVVAIVERDGHVGGFCGNIARYTEIVSREAAIMLITKARALYEQNVAL